MLSLLPVTCTHTVYTPVLFMAMWPMASRREAEYHSTAMDYKLEIHTKLA